MLRWKAVSLGEGVTAHRWQGANARVAVVLIDSVRSTGTTVDRLAQILGEDADLFHLELRGSGRNRDLDLTWGAEEVGDVERLVERIRKATPDLPIVFVGVSVGAAVLAVAAAKIQPALFIAGAPYDTFEGSALDILRDELGMTEAMLDFHLEQLRALDPPSPLDHAGAATCPALFLSGLDDTVVPTANVRRLAEAWGGQGELWELHAGHSDVLSDALDHRRRELIDRIFGVAT